MFRVIDWFVPGLLVAVGLAWLFPAPGAEGGWLHAGVVIKAAVALIYFLHGVSLPLEGLKAGALRWRVHALVQATTFVLFPLAGLGLKAVLTDAVPPQLALGAFYLCALPSTVSSSVVLTAAARGNVAVALFNASASGILGVFLTPLWVAAVLSVSDAGLQIGPVMRDLVLWLLLPLALGQAVRPWLAEWIGRHRGAVHTIDRGSILVLVYASFGDSFQQRVWSGSGPETVIIVAAVSAGLLILALGFLTLAAKRLKLGRAESVAAVFCGSQKTLATGVPMAKLIFGHLPGLGWVLLPIMIYHPLQLIVCGLLVSWWNRARHDDQAETAG